MFTKYLVYYNVQVGTGQAACCRAPFHVHPDGLWFLPESDHQQLLKTPVDKQRHHHQLPSMALAAHHAYTWNPCVSLVTKQQLTICSCSVIAAHGQIISSCSISNNNHMYLDRTSGQVWESRTWQQRVAGHSVDHHISVSHLPGIWLGWVIKRRLGHRSGWVQLPRQVQQLGCPEAWVRHSRDGSQRNPKLY